MSFLNGWSYGETDSQMAKARNFILQQMSERNIDFSVVIKLKPKSFGKE